jgi:hypothetical protein
MMTSSSNIQHSTGQKVRRKSAEKLPLAGQIAVIGRKFKQFFGANLSSSQWFLLLYVAGFGSLLLLATLLKVAMKLI